MRPARAWPLAAIVAASLTPPTSVGAQAEPTPRIDLVSQTTIVGPEPAGFQLEIDGAPADARLQICVNLPVTDRDDLRASRVDPPTACLVANYPVPLTEIAVEGAPGHYAVVVPDELVGEFLRADAGALPVVIDLVDSTRILDTLVTQLVVLATPSEEEPTPATVSLSFVTDVGAPLAHLPNEAVTNPGPTLGDDLAGVASLPADAVAVALRPESLAAADTVGGTTTLDPLVEALRAHELLLEPWVGIDEEGWRVAGETDMVLSQYAAGRSTVEELADVSPTGVVRLDPDVTDETIGLLRTAGATAALVEGGLLSSAALASADHQPVQVRDDNGVPMTTLIIDDRLPDTLGDDDHELAAYRALAELLLISAGSDDDRAVVVDLDSIDGLALGLLLEFAGAIEQIGTGPLSAAFELPFSRTSTGAIVEVRLRGEEPEDLADTADVQRFARAAIDAYEGMVTSTQAPIVPLRTLLLASADDGLDDEGRAAYTTAVIAAVTRGTRGITIVESERITLATRTADLPVTIRNEQTVPVTVALSLRGEKLRFPDGDERTIELQPGDNALTVRVEARASGDARVTATLRSPDGRIELDEAVIPIRSTALSGIGLLISAVALSVLLVWWIRTVRRTRRARGAATVPASVGDQADPVRGDPGAQGSMEES